VPNSLPRATRYVYNGAKILSCADGEAGVAGANGMLAVSLAACKAGAASLGHTFSKVLSIVAFCSKCTRPLIFGHVSQAGPSTDTLPSWQRTAD
jgi:enolase